MAEMLLEPYFFLLLLLLPLHVSKKGCRYWSVFTMAVYTLATQICQQLNKVFLLRFDVAVSAELK